MAKATSPDPVRATAADFEDGAGTPAAFASLDERYARLPIDQLSPSPHNPRRDFDAAKLEELAGSIREKGIVEPLVVRPVDGADDQFEIVAGERRYRAARLAGLTHVPALVRRYSDEAVLELVLIENLQRQDLRPLEQAAGFKALMASNPEKHTLTWIATKVGMSEAWVWDRVKLADLTPAAKALLADDRISIGHAILLSRLKPTDQARAIDPKSVNRFGGSRDGIWQHDSGRLDLAEAAAGKTDPYADLKPVSVREFESWIKTHVRFDVVHAAQAQPLAFEATAAQVTAAASQPGRGKKVVSITHEYRVPDAARDDTERTFGRDAWVRADGQAKSKTCEHSVLGVVVAGAGYGQTLQVCVARDRCRVHFGAIIKAKEKAEKQRASGKPASAAKTVKKANDTWQEQERRREAERQAYAAFKPIGLRAIAKRIPAVPFTNALAASLIDLSGDDATFFRECLGGPVTVKNLGRALRIAEVFDRSWSLDELAKFGKRYRVDIKALAKQHATKAAAPAADQTSARKRATA